MAASIAADLVDACIRQVLVPELRAEIRQASLDEILEARRNGGWFDVRAWCACGYSFAFDPEETLRPHRWRHATCGHRERHRWLIGKRRMRLLRA